MVYETKRFKRNVKANTIRAPSTIYKDQTCLPRTLPSVCKDWGTSDVRFKICIFSDIWVE